MGRRESYSEGRGGRMGEGGERRGDGRRIGKKEERKIWKRRWEREE